ncbi:MAG TPA: TonB family protein [Pyrinomonadaceae bacterium]|jgi:TonB family protein
MKRTGLHWLILLFIIAIASEALAFNPQDAQDAGAYKDRGKAHLNAGRYNEAVEALKQAVRLKADDAEAHNNLGVAYTKSHHSFDAIDPLKETIRLKPSWPEPYNNLGVVYLKTIKYEEAIKALEEAVRLKADWAEAHFNLGAAYARKGDRDKAQDQQKILSTMNAALANSLNDVIEGKSRIVNGGVLNGKALSLPKPNYPAAAKMQHASGTVTVQVTIDEEGRVIAAKAVSGPPVLQAEAVNAARQARFSPTKLEGLPVKVTGFITYNFVAW